MGKETWKLANGFKSSQQNFSFLTYLPLEHFLLLAQHALIQNFHEKKLRNRNQNEKMLNCLLQSQCRRPVGRGFMV